MNKAARVHGSWWGGLMLAMLRLGFGIQQWVSAEHWQNLQAQTLTSVDNLQNNLGPSIPFNLEKLKTLPEELVLLELKSRFASATNPRHKLSLAFALADYGHLDADYLVSRIDDINESDTGNYITALVLCRDLILGFRPDGSRRSANIFNRGYRPAAQLSTVLWVALDVLDS